MRIAAQQLKLIRRALGLSRRAVSEAGGPSIRTIEVLEAGGGGIVSYLRLETTLRNLIGQRRWSWEGCVALNTLWGAEVVRWQVDAAAAIVARSSGPSSRQPIDPQRRAPESGGRIAQRQACYRRFTKLQDEGIIPTHFTLYDYAYQVLGVQTDSLKSLNTSQLNALQDKLEGKSTKLLSRLCSAAKALDIDDLAAWMKRQSSQKAFAYLTGYTLETLPENLLCRITRWLCARKICNERWGNKTEGSLGLFA